MTATVADVIHALDRMAPFALAETWDNCGLQIGGRDWPAKRIAVALDPLPEVVKAAVDRRMDVLITHHPLIFKPLAAIDTATPVGDIIQTAMRHQLALIAVHTNLDAAAGGLNDLLAARIGLANPTPLVRAAGGESLKLVVYVPVGHEARILDALSRTPAGIIGRYAACSFRNPGTGVFRPEAGTAPYLGAVGSLTEVAEVRIETVVRPPDLDSILAALAAVHPYEEMAYDVYPLVPPKSGQGLGRIGDIVPAAGLAALAASVKETLGLQAVKVAGDPSLQVTRAAVCTGSGAGLLKRFLRSDAQVYISGDLKYHDARDVENAGKGLIDVGHFPSEHLMANALADSLKQECDQRGVAVAIHPFSMEKDPFYLA